MKRLFIAHTRTRLQHVVGELEYHLLPGQLLVDSLEGVHLQQTGVSTGYNYLLPASPTNRGMITWDGQNGKEHRTREHYWSVSKREPLT